MRSGGVERRGSRLGNVRIRRGRRQSRVVEVRRMAASRPQRPGLLYLILGFMVIIAIGTVLLLLPIATRSGESAGFTAALFTSTSAVCVTGLVVVDTYNYWSTFGQAVILLLIQVGGLGFMTSSTLLFLLIGRRLSFRQRMLTGEMVGPVGRSPLSVLIRRIVLWTLAIEAVGVVVMMALFAFFDGGLSPHNAWSGLFTSISAFNNAGFDLQGDFRSLTEFSSNPFMLGAIGALATFGATGFAVWSDIATHRRWRRLALNTKIILATHGLLIGVGVAVILLELYLPRGTTPDLPVAQSAGIATLESVYARTSGFTAIDLGDVRGETLLAFAGLMFIGGAPASTAGGIKLTTFSALFFAIIASVRGDEHVTAFNREIPWRQVNRALSIALLAVAFVFVATFAVSVATGFDFVQVLFEVVSAFATCGLSTGITPELNDGGRLLLVVSMFVGRLGPLTFALALASRFGRRERIRYPEEELAIG